MDVVDISSELNEIRVRLKQQEIELDKFQSRLGGKAITSEKEQFLDVDAPDLKTNTISIQNYLKQTAKINWPNELALDKIYHLQLKVSIGDSIKSLRGKTLIAGLSGQGFKCELLDSERKTILLNDTITWSWQILPISAIGEELGIFITVLDPNRADNIVLEAYSHVQHIHVVESYWVKFLDVLSRHNWLITSVAGSAFFVKLLERMVSSMRNRAARVQLSSIITRVKHLINRRRKSEGE